MKLGKVVGTVVSTIKAPIFEGRTLLLVDLLEPDGRAASGYLIAVDTVGAGAGETVLVLDEGTSARQIVGAPYGPLRAVIVGIVDAVESDAQGRQPAPNGRTAAKARPAAKRTPATEPRARDRRRTDGT